MQRFFIINCLLFTVCVFTERQVSAEPAFGKKPNIILIITDDREAHDVSGHGNPHIPNPNLDQLRKDSLRFTRFR